MRRFFTSALMLTLIAGVANADFTGTGAGNAFVDDATVSSTINVSGTTGNITDVIVTITDMEHTWAGDLNATLSNGTSTIDLFTQAEDGVSGFGANVDLDGDYTFGISGGTGTWEDAMFAADTDNGGTGALPGPQNFDSAALGDFLGQAKDGDWTLSITDNAGGDSGQYAGWTLNLVSGGAAIPEPTTFGLLAGFAGFVAARRRR